MSGRLVMVSMCCEDCRRPWVATPAASQGCPFCGSAETTEIRECSPAPKSTWRDGTPFDQALRRRQAQRTAA